MRLLVVASMYPHPGLPYSGIFNQNCVDAAQSLGHHPVVLVPRPLVPPFLKMHPRWAAYAQIPAFAERNGVEVHRPNFLQLPKLDMTFQRNQSSYWQMGGTAERLHRQHQFDAVFSFDLGGAGGLAWRLAKRLGIPATGWAFGLDVRIPRQSSDAREMRRILRELDLVYYQSSELRECASRYTETGVLEEDRHVVLPHGIPPMPAPTDGTRQRMRRELEIDDKAIVVLFLSRVVRSKGAEELLAAIEFAAAANPNVQCVAVGESPGFDDSQALRAEIEAKGLSRRFRLLPACAPDEVAQYHALADIFAFPSKSEGMPNALLEAMSLGTPSVVFDIPPIRDILSHGNCLLAAPSFDALQLGQAILRLANSADQRAQLAATARRVVGEHYDITRNIEQALQLLQPIVDANNR